MGRPKGKFFYVMDVVHERGFVVFPTLHDLIRDANGEDGDEVYVLQVTTKRKLRIKTHAWLENLEPPKTR